MNTRLCISLFAVALLTPLSSAQPPAPVNTPNPLAPTLALSAPVGMQRETSLEITLTGTNLAEPTGVWTSFPAKVTIPTDMNNGKDASKLRVRFEVGKDAPLGFHTIRVATTRGISNFRPFCVDDLPQLLEVDTNRNKTTPQVVPVPCVVVGRADAEVSDYFKITVAAKQRLSFDVIGRRLGSAFDPQLTLFDVRTGRELPGGYSNDAPGCQTDPRLTYTFPTAGEYLVEIRDVQYRGGADFYYRLRIGDFPCATTPIPMAAKRGSKVSVTFAGTSVESARPVEVTTPSDPGQTSVNVTPLGANGLPGWPVLLALTDHEELVEQEPNNDPAKAMRLPIPCGVTGRFQSKGDVDHFVFAAKKGQRYFLTVKTLEYGSPTEVYMTLKDSKGAQIAVSNPAAAPPVSQRLDFTAQADGDYVLGVEHLHYWGGPAESYHLTVEPYHPSVDLTLQLDRFDVPPGAGTLVFVQATPVDYVGPIELKVVGPPGLAGQATIPAGQTSTLLHLKANPEMSPGPHAITVQGTVSIPGAPRTVVANARATTIATLAGLPFPPLSLPQQIGAAVIEKSPFQLAVKFETLGAVRGLPATLLVSATRAPNFSEEIALAALALPANVAVALKPIPKGANEVKLQLTPAANAALGQFLFGITGKTKHNAKDYAGSSSPVELVVGLPFDLKTEPTLVKLAQGGKGKLKVSAVRKGGYTGPITLTLQNLPAKLTAPPMASIAANQLETEIELSAATDAAAGEKADVSVQGTATGAGNQQNQSTKFTISVTKKDDK